MSSSKSLGQEIPKEATLTQGEVLILSLLSEGSNYPYQIQKMIIEREVHNWMDIGFSSIYHALDRLENKKLVSSTYHKPEKSSRRQQRIFTLTKTGYRELKSNVAYLIGQYIDKSPSTIGFANFLLFDSKELPNLIKTRQEKIQQRIDLLLKRDEFLRESLKEEKDETKLLVNLLFEYALLRHKAELEFIKMVKEKWLKP